MSKVTLKLDFKTIVNGEKAGLRRAINEVTDATVKDMQANVPVDTGFLRSSIKRGRSNTQGTLKASIGTGGGNAGITAGAIVVGAHYAAYVEYGTSRMAAQPYFEPAMERAKRLLETAAKGILGKYGRLSTRRS